jgi:hypothetical protein
VNINETLQKLLSQKCWWDVQLDMGLITPVKFWWNFKSSIWVSVHTSFCVGGSTRTPPFYWRAITRQGIIQAENLWIMRKYLSVKFHWYYISGTRGVIRTKPILFKGKNLAINQYSGKLMSFTQVLLINPVKFHWNS